MEAIEEIDYKGHKINIYSDDNNQNPRTEWDNLGTIAYKHSNYELGEEKINDPIDWLLGMLDDEDREVDYNKESLSEISEEFYEKFAAMPLYIYEHGGITISTGSFSCRWDSGQFGYIYCSLEDAIKNWILPKDSTWDFMMDDWKDDGKQISLKDATIRLLQSEVETFDQYLTGEVYGYMIGVPWDNGEDQYDEEGGCWGFYGSNHEKSGLLEHAKPDIDYMIEQNEEKLRSDRQSHYNKVKNWIKSKVAFQYRKPLTI